MTAVCVCAAEQQSGNCRHRGHVVTCREHADMQWLEASTAVVAECTVPSLGVGYEIAMAHTRGKPILCLYRPAPGRCMSCRWTGPSTVLRPSCDVT
jgi:hypothetical protein